MKVNKKPTSIVLFTSIILFLQGCGGGSDDDGNTQTVNTGVLLDSAVENIEFSTATESGSTNSKGEFTYKDGEIVTFSIGDLSFPSVEAEAIITPITLASATSIIDQQATNIARLLQSLDSDGNPDNGIEIHPDAESVASQVDFNVDPVTFENNASVINLVANSGATTTTLISAADAQDHVTETLEDMVTGVWRRTTSGGGFNYLTMFADNTFTYAENDLAFPSPPNNGIEVGTYTYDANSGNITFDIAYDDNAPGDDSGIGDIGTLKVIDSSLSNGGDTLTLAGGAVVLSKAF